MKRINGKKVVIAVIIIVLISKILGLLKQMVISSVYGTTIETDVISLSQDFVSTLQYIITQMILTAFTSIYIYEKKKGENEGCTFISEVLKLFLLISSGCTLLVFVAAPLISRILAPTYNVDLSSSLALYLRIYSFSLIPFTIIAIFSAILNSNEKYIHHELSNVIQNIVVIAVVLLLNSIFHVDALVIATYSYIFVNSVYLVFFSRKHIDLKTINKTSIFKSERIKSLIKMLLPLLIGFSMVYVNQQVDKIIVSGMKEGTVTCLSYGASLSNLVTSIIAALCAIFYTKITNSLSENDYDSASNLLSKSIVLLVSFVVPIVGISLMCSKDIVAIIFERGNFNANATETTALALFGYVFSFIPFILKTVFDRLHYGNKRSVWPMVTAFISLGINVALSIVLSRFLGVMGVTLASSIAEAVSAVLIIIITFVRFKWLKLKKVFLSIPFWLIGMGVVMALSFWLSSSLSSVHVILRFLVITLVCFAIYFVVILPVYYQYLKAFLLRIIKRNETSIKD